MQDLSWDFEGYNPGEAYWDVFAFDIYDKGYDKSWYDYILKIVGDRPIAIGECMKLPSESLLAEQPRWIFFMPWAELVKAHNSEEDIRKIYDHPRVLSRKELPQWQKR